MSKGATMVHIGHQHVPFPNVLGNVSVGGTMSYPNYGTTTGRFPGTGRTLGIVQQALSSVLTAEQMEEEDPTAQPEIDPTDRRAAVMATREKISE